MSNSSHTKAIRLPDGLSDTVSSSLSEFAAAAQMALGADLSALILFGSAAEGRMRAMSDVNILIVTEEFDVMKIDALREALRVAKVQINLAPMFLCRRELPFVIDAFAVKFDDIIRRHFTLYGDDLISSLAVSKEAMLRRVHQVLINLELRLRERYAVVSLREEQLVGVIADLAPALRSAASSVIELEGGTAPPVRQALRMVLTTTDRPDLNEAVDMISVAREQGVLPVGMASRTILAMLTLTGILISRLRRLY